MDFIFASSLRGTCVKKVTISYDLACQWSRKLLGRVQALPADLRATILGLSIDTVVPKLHERGHREACWTLFSLNYRRGVGRTDGEGIERRWADTNDASNSTREMREGHRQDSLDDVCNDSNYRKTMELGGVSNLCVLTSHTHV